MKKSALYLTLVSILFAGCVRERIDHAAQYDGDGVPLTFGITVPDVKPAPTRTIVDYDKDATVQNKIAYLEALQFYIFVFEDTGSPESNYLRELVYAPKILEKRATDDGMKLELTATFDGTRENAIIHIVATADKTFEEQLRTVNDRSELGIFSGATGLCSFNSDKADNNINGAAYWRRIELNNPITNDASIKPKIQEALSNVNLIRNYARVTVKVDPKACENIKDENGNDTPDVTFELDAFVIVNSVDRGYVAAYNENVVYNPQIPDGAAKIEADNYTESGFITKGFEHKPDDQNVKDNYYNYLTRDMKYLPARHPQSKRQYPDDEYSWTAAFEASTDASPKYLFERSLAEEHKSFVVIKGHFSDDVDELGNVKVDESGNKKYRYIKLDIGTIDKSNIDPETQAPFGVFENLQIVRNISYDMTIKKLASRNVGHSLAESAVISPPSNNIPTSVETRKMTQISDGVDQMEVNATTIVIIDKDVPVLDENGEQKVENGNPVFTTAPDFDEGMDVIKWRYYTGEGYTTPASHIVKWNYPGYAFIFEDEKDPDGVIKSWGWTTGGTMTNKTVTAKNDYNKDKADNAEKNGTTYTYINESEEMGDGWRGFKLEYNTPTDELHTKTIRLYSPFGLTRDIYLVLRKRWEFVNEPVNNSQYESNVEVYPGYYAYAEDMDGESMLMQYNSLAEMRRLADAPGPVGTGRSQALTLMFELPGDIPEALFPLSFTIEFDRQNVDNYYASDAISYTDTSLFEEFQDSGEPRRQYIKTIPWSYYNGTGEPGNMGHKVVCVRFTTMQEYTGDARVRITNKYFLPGNDSYTQGD